MKMPLKRAGRAASAVLIGAALVVAVSLPLNLASPHQAEAAAADCTAGGTTAANLNTANLTKFKTALTQVATKPVNVVFAGDSITEGYGATSDNTRFQALVRQYLQKTYDPSSIPGGEGWIPYWHFAPIAQRWTMGGVDNNGQPQKMFTNPGFGLGQRGGVLSNTQWGQTTFTGDRFWLMYTEGQSVSALGITIDGGPMKTLWTNASATKSGRIWDSGPLTRGTHTVKVQATPTNGVPGLGVAEGIMVFNGDGGAAAGQGAGIRTWDDGMSGSNAASFSSSNNQYSEQTYDNVDPQLVVIGLGTNDALYYDANTFNTNLTQLIQKFKTGAPNASILLWSEADRTTLDPATWQTFVNAMYQVAQAQGTGIVDINARMGTLASDFALDTTHPNDAGYRMIADGMGQALGVVQCAPISGTLKDSASSAPLVGMCVSATDTATGAAVAYARTQTDGSYAIVTPPGSYNLKNWDCSPHYQTGNHSGTVGGNTSGINDTLTRQ